jgi:chemotaxis protein MotB
MRSLRAREHVSENHSRDRWLISYADLITLLLALFIVLYAASDKERAHQIAASFSAEGLNGNGVLNGSKTLENEDTRLQKALIENQILAQKTKMHQSKYGLVVSLSEAGFFAPGDATINHEAEAVIEIIAESLRSTSTAVRIEGHTDSTPISTAKYPSNWELSTARASSVLARLIDNGISPDRLSAAGYAGFQPVQDNATPDGRAQNRRVDIVILDR